VDLEAGKRDGLRRHPDAVDPINKALLAFVKTSRIVSMLLGKLVDFEA
jgi:hypothetical protein